MSELKTYSLAKAYRLRSLLFSRDASLGVSVLPFNVYSLFYIELISA